MATIGPNKVINPPRRNDGAEVPEDRKSKPEDYVHFPYQLAFDFHGSREVGQSSPSCSCASAVDTG